MITGATTVVGVIGDPVGHSLSPVIHNAAFAAQDLDFVSVTFPVAAAPGAADAALAAMRTMSVRGLSVTMPYKADVMTGVDTVAPSAKKLGVANCIVNDGGSLTAHNTDGDGFVRSLDTELGMTPDGARIAVLGAGGASRSIVEALGRNGAADIAIVNRTPERAVELAEVAPVARAAAPDDIAGCNLVINTTSVGMAGAGATDAMSCDVQLLAADAAVVDIIYNPLETAWLRAAREQGNRTLNGVPMLVQQAIIALELWTGESIGVDAINSAVADELARRGH